MEFRKIAIYVVGSLLLGILAAFVTKNILIGVGLPIGIIVALLLRSTLKGMEEKDKTTEEIPSQTPSNE